MAVSIHLTYFVLLLCAITQVLTLQCYRRYIVSGGTIDVSSTTALRTPENETCININCSCFSFKTVCSSSSSISAAYSPCSDEDKQKGTVQWQWGWTSGTVCENLRNMSQIYMDMVCCGTDLCNKQSPIITTTLNPNGFPSHFNLKWVPVFLFILYIL